MRVCRPLRRHWPGFNIFEATRRWIRSKILCGSDFNLKDDMATTERAEPSSPLPVEGYVLDCTTEVNVPESPPVLCSVTVGQGDGSDKTASVRGQVRWIGNRLRSCPQAPALYVSRHNHFTSTFTFPSISCSAGRHLAVFQNQNLCCPRRKLLDENERFHPMKRMHTSANLSESFM
jgi:hypothetical protein